MKDFSVIIPAYNVEDYIEKCVDSVLNQSYKNYEIIIVNDGSTDNTIKIINRKYKKDNIKIITKENGGLSSARNVGVENANGKYILFLDSDDWWERDLLTNLKHTINKTNADIVCFKLQKYYQKEDIHDVVNIPTFSNLSGIEALKKMIESHLTFETAVSFAYNSKFWKLNKFSFSEGKLHEDFGLTPYVVACAEKVVSIDYIGYNYYQREKSITKDNSYDKILKKCEDTLYHFTTLKTKFMNMNLDNYTKELIANYLMNACIKKIEVLNKDDQVKLYEKLKKNKSYQIFGNGTIKSYIKKVLIFINPKIYNIFIK